MSENSILIQGVSKEELLELFPGLAEQYVITERHGAGGLLQLRITAKQATEFSQAIILNLISSFLFAEMTSVAPKVEEFVANLWENSRVSVTLDGEKYSNLTKEKTINIVNFYSNDGDEKEEAQ